RRGRNGVPRDAAMSDAADPFGERRALPYRTQLTVLGGEFGVESENAALLELATDAFGGLPEHRLSMDPHRFRMSLVAADGGTLSQGDRRAISQGDCRAISQGDGGALWQGDGEPPR